MEEKLKSISGEYSEKINQAKSLKDLDEIFLAIFGKNGEITLLPKEFPALSVDEKKRVGPLFNQIKQTLEQEIRDMRYEIREEGYKKLTSETLSLQGPLRLRSEASVPLEARKSGHLHPNTIFIQEIVNLFEKIGFIQFDAPQIDTDYNNFEVLNLGPDHPARDLWDTLYIDSEKYGIKKGELLLRTHTSNAQIHIMKKFKPPFRVMSIGRCFRYENLDARHEHTFDQFEILYVDKDLTMTNLQYLSEYFLKSVLGKDIKVRLRPKYYPFTEPSIGFDGECIFCKGKGCKVCAGLGWIELGGGGMVHPQVLKNGGIDPTKYSGIAWGPGLQRIMMIKWGIDDVRSFLSGDLKFFENLP